jgi:hypothetical protein
MTSSDTVVPDHTDVARALSATLATVRGQLDVLPALATQCVTAADVDRFIMAVLLSFAGLLARKVDDPESYLLQWIALELELADAESRDTDVN